jgi:putative effector of murein hydrolase LrgA (UPF0299 family)
MTRRLAATHLIGNALLLWLVYYWLGLGEARASAVAWSAAVALIVVAGASWLHGAAFARSFKLALRHLPWTVLIAAVALAAYLALPAAKWWWIARWIVLPTLLVSLFAGAAAHGWRAWRGFSIRSLAAPALVFLGVWIPMRLLAWVPRVSSFSMEMTSFVLRAAVAYLLFVVAWLLLAFLTSGGNPRLTHPRTVASP